MAFGEKAEVLRKSYTIIARGFKSISLRTEDVALTLGKRIEAENDLPVVRIVILRGVKKNLSSPIYIRVNTVDTVNALYTRGMVVEGT